SIVACLVLQEASARVTVLSGRTLGEALRPPGSGGVGASWMVATAAGAILLGCAAYEGGNILGAAAGVGLVAAVSPALVAVVLGAAAGALLWLGSTRTVVRVMSVLVAVMGLAFLYAAAALRPAAGAVVQGALVPSVPAGSGLLVLGLVGTTVVPYNLFLGSGIAAGQRLDEMRFGLVVAVVLGGVISMAIVVVGSAVAGTFGYAKVAGVLAARLGPWGRGLFAAGLFAAGFSSAITAPLAAGITARSLFSHARVGRTWGEQGWRYRTVWSVVLGIGVALGATGVRPIPAIIAAQALNGVLLPLIAVFLLLVVNDRALLGNDGINRTAANVLTVAVCVVALLLGVANVVRAAAAAFALPAPTDRLLLWTALAAVAVLALPTARAVRRRRSS
ncbi:MAG: divalent metal cation transporter, partial [Acidobacteria bacterium]|nr:divalent metal cation transporter [Acidobacteriota bacterium]